MQRQRFHPVRLRRMARIAPSLANSAIRNNGRTGRATGGTPGTREIGGLLMDRLAGYERDKEVSCWNRVILYLAVSYDNEQTE